MKFTRKEFLKTAGLGVLAAPLAGPRSQGRELGEVKMAAVPKMKIREVEIYYLDIPLVEPFKISLGETVAANDVLVRVLTDSGLTGIGEACPFFPITGETQSTNIAMAQSIRPIILGKDPLAVESLLAAFPTAAHTNPSIVAAFDMALLDVLGQAAGLPLYKLLGGYRSTFETDITVGLNTPEKMAAKAQSHIDKGYKSIKVKVGQDPDLDFACLKAVRGVIGPDRAMRIDANQGWTVTQAIYALNKMEPLKIQYAEQPVLASDTAGLKAVRQESKIGIMADEALFSPADALKLIKAEACDFFNIKLMKAGGIMNSLRIAHIADAANILCMVGCMLETKLGLTAAAHLVASQKNIVFADLDGNSEHTIDPFVGGMTVKEGMITLPEKPGLGVDIDPAFLKKLKRV